MRGRIRTVKPELFLDERLWDLAQETGLPVLQAFIGLWCHADREGRFEWRPRALKTLVLPYWEGDFGAVLDALARARFIVRYEVAFDSYGYVRTFKSHQVVNQREAQSTLPVPPDDAPGEVPCTHVQAHGEGKGRELEGKGAGSGARAPEESPPEVPELQVVAPIARLARFVPDGWLPKDQHRVRCQESRLPFEDVLKRFRQQEFHRTYSDWDRRFDLWIDDQKTKAETERFQAQASPRSSGIRPVSDLDTTSAACAYNATSEQRAYATEHGLNVSDAVARCRGSPRFARLSTAEQEREMTHRLQLWRRTGAFPDPNEPLPRMKPKEARA